MKLTFYKAIFLSLFIGGITQGTQAAAIKAKPTAATLTFEKQLSPIEKALSQQKREKIAKNSLDRSDQTKVITNLESLARQNFFAEQHQRFSRFVQFIFPQHNS